MSKIKYIKTGKFFAKEYNDGVIVAFKNISDNCPSFADQIHQVVSKNFGVDIFVSDIVESITCIESHKNIIKDSLYIYVSNGVSISACSIHPCFNKDVIEVKYNSENVLTIKKKDWGWFWSVCILVVICILGYNVIFDNSRASDVTPTEEVEPVTVSQTKTIDPKKKPEQNNSIPANDSTADNNELPPVSIADTSVVIALKEEQEVIDDKSKLELVVTPIVPNDFILIPTGVLKGYLAGYDDNRNNVYKNFALDGFYICKHEVTQKEYMQVMGRNPSFIKGDDLPVNAVQYLDAIKYCNARSEAEGYDGFYIIDNNVIMIKPHSNGYRLPNRYEWVYAARKDESTKTKYASGNNISKVAWYGGNSKNTLHSVCTKKPNGRGIYDMNGNVSEWLWETDFQRCNCHIGGDFLAYLGFYEKDVVGSTVCSEENGFRVVLITKEQSNNNVKIPKSVKYHKLDYYHVVDVRIQCEKEDAERERQRKALKAEAKEYIRIADKAYAAYVENFDETQGAIALANYRKALALAKKHGLFVVSKTEKIEQSINALEKELK